MTTNRIARWLARGTGESDAPRVGSYWVLHTASGGYYLDPRTARTLARVLARAWPRRWIRFRDLAGSEVLVRRCDVRALVETTPTTRAADRRLDRAREVEERADQPPPWAED